MDIKRAGQERLLAVVNADPNAVDVTVPGHGDSDSAQSTFNDRNHRLPASSRKAEKFISLVHG